MGHTLCNAIKKTPLKKCILLWKYKKIVKRVLLNDFCKVTFSHEIKNGNLFTKFYIYKEGPKATRFLLIEFSIQIFVRSFLCLRALKYVSFVFVKVVFTFGT